MIGRRRLDTELAHRAGAEDDAPTRDEGLDALASPLYATTVANEWVLFPASWAARRRVRAALDTKSWSTHEPMPDSVGGWDARRGYWRHKDGLLQPGA